MSGSMRAASEGLVGLGRLFPGAPFEAPAPRGGRGRLMVRALPPMKHEEPWETFPAQHSDQLSRRKASRG